MDKVEIKQLLIAWERFKKENWYESEAVNVEALLMDEFAGILRLPNVKRGDNTDISKLEKGDYIMFSKEVRPIPKNFTTGKKYKILDKRVSEARWKPDALQVRHDNGGVYWIPLSNTYKRWSCVMAIT